MFYELQLKSMEFCEEFIQSVGGTKMFNGVTLLNQLQEVAKMIVYYCFYVFFDVRKKKCKKINQLDHYQTS